MSKNLDGCVLTPFLTITYSLPTYLWFGSSACMQLSLADIPQHYFVASQELHAGKDSPDRNLALGALFSHVE